MNKRVVDFVDLYFADMPYSDDMKTARGRIIEAMCAQYDTFVQDGSSSEEAFELLVGRYGKFADMARLAGFLPEEYATWKSDDAARGIASVKKEIRRQRLRVYLSAGCGTAALYGVFWLVYDFIYIPVASLFMFAFMGLVASCAFFVLRGFIRTEKARTDKYDAVAYMYLRDLADKYTKRRLNGIAIAAFCVLLFVTFAFSSVIFSHTKASELTEVLLPSMILLEIPLFICIKNKLCFDLIYRRIKFPVIAKTRKHYIGVLSFSAGYCLLTGLTVCLLGSASYFFNVLIGMGVLYAALIVVYNYVFRKRITYKNFRFNYRRIAVFVAVIVLFTGFRALNRETWYTQPYINSVAVVEHNAHKIDYDEESGVYTITSSAEDFKILHLTDIHLGGSLFSYRKDLKALNAVYAEIKYAKPDFVIVTGDLCFPLGIMSLSLNNSAPVYQFAAFMRNVGIPWAFTYGNHDTEDIATVSKKDLNEIYKQLSFKTSGNLLYPYVQAEINGRNNQMIKICRADGSLNTALFLIDSNAYTGNGINDYDYIHPDQVEWYANNVRNLTDREGKTVPSMVFFHIPLQEYRIAYDLYLSGSDEVKYFFGRNGGDDNTDDPQSGKEKVCCSDYPSRLFDKMVELGSTTAAFCGHDHYNNMSLEYKGIRLTYGMSIDYLAMPGIENSDAQRGAELITIHSDGSWDLVQIPLKEIA